MRRAPSGSQLDGKSARHTGQGAAVAHAPKQGLEGGLAWNFHVPRRPLGGVVAAQALGAPEPSDRHHRTRDREDTLARRGRTLEIEAEHATVTATRAGAAERAAALAPQVTALTGKLAEPRAGVPALDGQHQKAWAANQDAASFRPRPEPQPPQPPDTGPARSAPLKRPRDRTAHLPCGSRTRPPA